MQNSGIWEDVAVADASVHYGVIGYAVVFLYSNLACHVHETR